jgi:RHS repeat-associated protein
MVRSCRRSWGSMITGARFYDPIIGRWNVVDKKSELYFSHSQYVYALNSPTNAIDPDGHLVIFINGNHFGEGATGYENWRKRKASYNYNWKGSSDYWNAGGKSFDGAVMKQLGDNESIYRDGAIGGFFGFNSQGLVATNMASYRKNQGIKQGELDAETIIANLARDKTTGEIVETIKIITHSMGGAYGKGYVKALKKYISTLPRDQQAQIKITLVADFDPFQAGSITADPDIKTTQYKHKGNSNILGMGWLANEDEQGLSKGSIRTNTGTSTDHSIFTFLNDISSLSEGTYKWNGNKWIKQ